MKKCKYEHEEFDHYPDPITCPECGSEDIDVETSYENTDADGNRGIWMTFMDCNKCGCEGWMKN